MLRNKIAIFNTAMTIIVSDIYYSFCNIEGDRHKTHFNVVIKEQTPPTLLLLTYISLR